MIARFVLLCLCKGYRHCQRCIGLIKALKLISKGTSVRLLLNIECCSGICLKLKVKKEKLCKLIFFFFGRNLLSNQFRKDYSFSVYFQHVVLDLFNHVLLTGKKIPQRKYSGIQTTIVYA